MRSAARLILRSFARRLLQGPFGAPIRSVVRGHASVLMYHRVAPVYRDSFEPQRSLRVLPADFEEQMEYVARHYTVLSVHDLLERVFTERTFSRHYVAITFDDGYADNLHFALPILEKYEIPATIFVTTGYVEGNDFPWWDELAWCVARLESIPDPKLGNELVHSCKTPAERESTFLLLNEKLKQSSPAVVFEYRRLLRSRTHEQMPTAPGYEQSQEDFLNWSELRSLSNHPLITLGAHTCRHCSLRYCSEEEARAEILDSVEELGRKTGMSPELFAYPFGSANEVSEREFDLTAELGLRAAFTTRFAHMQRAHRKWNTALPRIAIDGHDSLDDFARKLSGYDALVANRGRAVIVK